MLFRKTSLQETPVRTHAVTNLLSSRLERVYVRLLSRVECRIVECFSSSGCFRSRKRSLLIAEKRHPQGGGGRGPEIDYSSPYDIRNGQPLQ